MGSLQSDLDSFLLAPLRDIRSIGEFPEIVRSWLDRYDFPSYLKEEYDEKSVVALQQTKKNLIEILEKCNVSAIQISKLRVWF